LAVNNQQDIPPEILKAIPGTVGSLVALRWVAGPPLQRMAAVLGGVGGAYYGTPYLAGMMGTDHGLTGFLIGLFGMAIAAKVFEAITAFDLGSMLDRFLKKWGL
jgi:hypothetical protein